MTTVNPFYEYKKLQNRALQKFIININNQNKTIVDDGLFVQISFKGDFKF